VDKLEYDKLVGYAKLTLSKYKYVDSFSEDNANFLVGISLHRCTDMTFIQKTIRQEASNIYRKPSVQQISIEDVPEVSYETNYRLIELLDGSPVLYQIYCAYDGDVDAYAASIGYSVRHIKLLAKKEVNKLKFDINI
jgi:hypothetical protein